MLNIGLQHFWVPSPEERGRAQKFMNFFPAPCSSLGMSSFDGRLRTTHREDQVSRRATAASTIPGKTALLSYPSGIRTGSTKISEENRAGESCAPITLLGKTPQDDDSTNQGIGYPQTAVAV